MSRTNCLMSWLCLAPLSAQTLTWHDVTPAASPPTRILAGMVYRDAAQQCVLFGGRDGFNSLGDTWIWDGAAWTNVTPATSPAARQSVGMAYDPASDRVILFGGRDLSNIFYGDTWAWDGANWTQLSPANSPPARGGMSLTYDPMRQVMVGFGGRDPLLGGETARTYEFDGTDWSEIIPLHIPPQRMQAGMYFNEARGRVQIYGGQYAGGYLTRDDVWEWDGADWLELTPLVSPPPRFAPAVAYDKSLQRMVRLGGAFPFAAQQDDQWFWDGQWHDGAGTNRPPPHNGAAMAFDEARQQLVLLTGLNPTPTTWVGESGYLASRTTYGTACASSPPSSSILTSGIPTIGTTLNVRVVLPPTPMAFLALGWNNTSFNGQSLPIDLTSMGMTGCSLLTSADVLGLPMPVVGSWPTYLASLPNISSLLGAQVYLQGFVLAPGANPLGVISTHGVEWMVGNL